MGNEFYMSLKTEEKLYLFVVSINM